MGVLDTFMHEVLPIVGLVIIGLFAFKIYEFFRPAKREEEKIIKKEELVSSAKAKALKSISSRPDNGVLAPSMPNGEDFYVSTSDRACIIGPPGTGKTSFLVNQIYKWSNTGKSFVCLDIKPEIYKITKAELEKKGYKCIVYNPTDPVDCYDFLQDLDSPETIGEFASALIPSESAENAVFSDTARDLLDALINHFRALSEQRARTAEKRKLAGKSEKEEKHPNPTLPAIYDFLKQYSSITALFNDLAHSPSSQTKAIINSLSITASNERLLGSIFATFNSKLRFLRYENVRKSLSGGFSLSELNNRKVALFLQFEETKMETIGHLFSVFVGHMLRYLITSFEKREEVFCLLDEIGNAGQIHDLTGKLNTIRSRNMPTWMYWQSKEQMQKYGKTADEGVNIIMGACDLQMCFRLNDNATSQWFSERVGTHIVTNVSSGSSFSDVNSRSNNRSLSREEVIFPHQLQQLKDGEVVAIYRGISWKGKATPYWQLRG